MAKVIFIEDSGVEHIVEVQSGQTLMEAAKKNHIPGIEADCGGVCSCSTCHVYVHPEWINKIPKMDEMEQDMLDFAYKPDRRFSRLTCKIVVDETLDGIILKLPKRQI